MKTAKLDGLLCFAVYSAGHAFNRIYKPMLDDLGLTYPQYLVMVVLWTNDGRTVGELGQHLFLESNTLTPMLKKLESLGYLVRKRSSEDERQVRITLTASGRKLAQAARGIPKCLLKASGLSAQELVCLQTDIARVRDNLLASV